MFGARDSAGAYLLSDSELSRRALQWNRLSELEREDHAVDFASVVILEVVGRRAARFEADVADPDDRRKLVAEARRAGQTIEHSRAVFRGPVSEQVLRAILDSNQIVLEIFVEGVVVAAIHDSVLESMLLWLRPEERERLRERLATD